MNAVAAEAARTRPHRAVTVAVWVVQVALAFVVGSGGAMKLAADPVTVQMFDDIGAGQWFRVVVGALEVAGAVGLLVPRLATRAAAGLALLLLGATVTNLAVLHADPAMSAALMVTAAVVVVVRRRRRPPA